MKKIKKTYAKEIHRSVKLLTIITILLINFSSSFAQCRWANSIPNDAIWDKGNDVLSVGSDSYVTGEINGHMFVAKTGCNSLNQFYWLASATGTGSSVGQSIKFLGGYVYVSGVFSGTETFSGSTTVSSNDGKIFIAKYDPATGALQLVKQDGKLNSSISGSNIYKALMEVISAPPQAILLTGSFVGGIIMNSTIPFTSAQNPDLSYSKDVFVARYSAVGPTYQLMQTTNSPRDEDVFGIKYQFPIINIVGEYDSKILGYPGPVILWQACLQNGFVLRIDPSNLNSLVGYTISSGFNATTGVVTMRGIDLDASGNIYVSGNFFSSNPFSPNSLYASYDLSTSWNVLTPPSTFTLSNPFVLKLNGALFPNNFVTWAKVPGQPPTGQSTEIQINDLVYHQGKVYIGGYFYYGDAEFGSTTLVHSVPILQRDAFIANLDPSNGNNVTAVSYGSAGDEEVLALESTSDCPVLASGYYQYNVVFPGDVTLTSANLSKDMFVLSENLTGNPVMTITYGTPTVTAECSYLLDCDGVQLTAVPSTLPSYVWNPPLSTTNSIFVTNSASISVSSPSFTSACSCGNTAVLNLSGQPNITITPSPSNIICEGQSTQLTASGAVSYTWSPSTGLTYPTPITPDNPIVFASPTTTTIYTVTGTGANGCTGTATITVIVNPFTPPVITGFQNNCGTVSGSTQYSVQALPGYQYDWDINNITGVTSPTFPVINANQILVDYTGSSVSSTPSSGEICVFALAPNGCSATVCLPIFQCCSLCKGATTGTYFYIDNSTAAAQLGDPQFTPYVSGSIIDLGTVTDAKIIINGVFDINQPLTFRNVAQICFGPEAKTTVSNGNILTLENCPLIWASCDIMWDGIYVDPSSQLIINPTTNTDVMDAKNAVVSNDGGNFQIHDAHFFNNNKGIIANPHAGLHSGSIKTCTFNSASGMLPFYIGSVLQNPLPRTHIGMEIKSVDAINIGDATISSYRNHFHDIDIGIESSASSITVENNEFYNIIKTNWNCIEYPWGPPCNVEGFAIYSHGLYPEQPIYPILMVGGSTAAANDFNNCTYGVYSNFAQRVTVNYNNFTNTDNGVRVVGSMTEPIEIKFNHLNLFYNGLSVINNRDCNIDITDNIFNDVNTTIRGTAIRVLNPVNDILTATNIRNNNIKFIVTGIQTTNLYQANIDNYNQIMFDGTGVPSLTSMGIKVQNSKLNFIGYNTVFRCNSSNNVPACWPTDHLYIKKLIGISVEGCNDVRVHGNITQYLGTGLRCFNSFVPNLFTCNSMSFNTRGFWLDYADAGQQGGPGWPSDNAWNITNFTSREMDVFGSSGSPLLQKWYVRSLNYPSAAEPLHVSPSSQVDFLQTTGPWNCPVIPHAGAKTLQEIQAELASTLRKVLQEGNGMSEEAIYLTEKEVLEELYNNPALMNLGTSDDTYLTDFYNTAMATNLGSFVQIKNYIGQNDPEGAKDVNSSITPDNQIEQNEKIANSIYLSTWAKGIYLLDPDQIQALTDIAGQNPISGGPGVYTARVMLDIDFNDFGPEEENRLASERPDVQHIVNVYPNPTSGETIFTCELFENEKGTLEIYDMLGNLQLKYILREGENNITINMNHLASGVYFSKVKINDASDILSKIVLFK